MAAIPDTTTPAATTSATRPLRLLWLIDSLHIGGAEALAVTFARHVDRSRVELFVCCLNSIGGNPLEADLRAAGITPLNLGARNLRDVRAFRRLLQFVREQEIDLVHAHLTYASIWGALLARVTGIPMVSSLHVRVASTREQETSEQQRKRVGVRDRLLRFTLRRWSSAVIMVSAALRDDYLAGGGLHGAPLRVVHNGIEVERFAGDRTATRVRLQRELGIPLDVPLAATVSVLRPGKGVEVLLEAMRVVPRLHVLIIGDGPKRDEWCAMADAYGLSDRVHWAGFRRDVNELLPGADLMIHPSLDDAFPTVLLEAAAAALPVVASRLGGIPEIVQEGVTGTLVPGGDASQLAIAVRTLLANPEALEEMGAAARARAEALFSTRAWIDRLDAVYGEALRNK
jgi:glycosyltransferase involved in cell wall biosynthesis